VVLGKDHHQLLPDHNMPLPGRVAPRNREHVGVRARAIPLQEAIARRLLIFSC
jgi:hypothetical protein